MIRVFHQMQAAAKGVRLHKLAQDLIREGVTLPRNSKTLNMYVNDAIGLRMIPEQPLFYSENWFGTADALRWDEKKRLLRVHDLKTGVTEAKFTQLFIYCALFCVEYGHRPFDIKMEVRIYQNDAVKVAEPDPGDVMAIMEKGKFFDKLLRELKEDLS